jgi:hypothetical protein
MYKFILVSNNITLHEEISEAASIFEDLHDWEYGTNWGFKNDLIYFY